MMVQTDLLVALVTFCVVTLFTPGPNNIMLMTSGLNFGAGRTVPHLFGVCLGFAAMVAGVGFGLGTLFQTWPALYPILKYAGATYLLYLAWKIANAGPVNTSDGTAGTPMTFLQAVAFQWVNPKAWVMAVGAISAYGAVATFPSNVLIMSSLYGVLGFASGTTWLGFGLALQRIIKNPANVRLFNIIMALLLVASLYPIFAEGLG
jgi:threonine/homoserine/homoserine lactone efflux protein